MSECACVYVVDREGVDFISETMRTSRKTYKCSCCGRAIGRGERYEHTQGKWWGEFDTFRTCEDCLSLRYAFFCDGFYYGPEMYECLSNHIEDVGGKISSDCILPLTAAARDWVFDEIQEVWDEQGRCEGLETWRTIAGIMYALCILPPSPGKDTP